MRRVIAAALAALVSTSAAFAVDIETALGPVSIAETPKRVAAYDIASIDTLERLGVQPAGTPVNLYTSALDAVAKKAKPVGTVFEPDLEALNALEPDLVIVGGRSSPKKALVEKVAPAIDMSLSGTDLIGGVRARVAAFGTLFGKEAEAKAATAELDAALAAARKAAEGKGTALIIMTNGPKISAFGAGSRFGWVHAALGMPTTLKEMQNTPHGEAVSFEFVAKADPDWLIVLDRAAAIGSNEQNAKATLDNEIVAGTKAWKNGHVVYVPPADFYVASGGVQATTRVLTALAKALSAAE